MPHGFQLLARDPAPQNTLKLGLEFLNGIWEKAANDNVGPRKHRRFETLRSNSGSGLAFANPSPLCISLQSLSLLKID
jgi:hypothetical protein